MTKDKEMMYDLKLEGLELEKKRNKLSDYIKYSKEYKDLSDDVKSLLIMQKDAMSIYLRSLSMRLDIMLNDDLFDVRG